MEWQEIYSCGHRSEVKDEVDDIMPARVRARVKGVKGYINAMRPTWLSNPFSLDKYSREESLLLYEDYLRVRLDEDKDFAKRFDSINRDTASCFKPIRISPGTKCSKCGDSA